MSFALGEIVIIPGFSVPQFTVVDIDRDDVTVAWRTWSAGGRIVHEHTLPARCLSHWNMSYGNQAQ